MSEESMGDVLAFSAFRASCLDGTRADGWQMGLVKVMRVGDKTVLLQCYCYEF